MNLFSRRLIICLLLLLQGFTPLVHAHVQMIGSIGEGIHIDEISRAWYQSDSAALSRVDDSAVAIDMQLAIEQKRLLLEGKLAHAIFFDTNVQLTHPLVFNKLIGFSPPIIFVVSSVYLSAIAPRAPPVLSLHL